MCDTIRDLPGEGEAVHDEGCCEPVEVPGEKIYEIGGKFHNLREKKCSESESEHSKVKVIKKKISSDNYDSLEGGSHES